MSQIIPLREPASRRFTDRDEPKARFEQELASGADNRRVLVWYGVGGQGKTALRNEFERLIRSRTERPIALGVLDFDVPAQRQPIEALLHLRFELASTRRLTFPTFDIAFAQLFALSHRGEDIRQRYPRLFHNRESELLTDLLALAEAATSTIVGAPLLYKYGFRLAGRLRTWLARADVQSAIGQIQRWPANKLRDRLPTFLTQDLNRALEADDAPRVVVMLDAYEALWRDTPRGALENLRVDGWVRNLVEDAPGATVAIFSRDMLRWSELSDRWDARLEQHLLSGLSEQDAHRFLQEAGITSRAVRDRIVTGANGLPFYLDLALDLHEDIANREQRAPEPDDFGDTPGDVLERFRDHLSDVEVEDLEIASYFEVVDETTMSDVSRALRGRLADWARLGQRSYMTREAGGALRMHALMREATQAREERVRPGFYTRAHRFLFERFDGLIRSAVEPRELRADHEHALVAAARHGAVTERPHLAKWIVQRQLPFAEAGRWLALERAFALVDDALGPLPAGDRMADGVWFYHHYAHVCQYMGLFPRAKDLYQRARENYPRDADSQAAPEYATILDALADVCWEMDERQEAEGLYAQARAIYETAPDRYPIRHAYGLFKLARCRGATGDAESSEILFQHAYGRFESLAATHPRESAGFLIDFARIRREQNRLADAVAAFAKARDLYARPGGDAAGHAEALLELAVCASQGSDRDSAAALFEDAVARHDETFGADHPNLGRALHLQAAFWLGEAPADTRPVTQLARAADILSRSLGDDHVWTTACRADAARAHAVMRAST